MVTDRDILTALAVGPESRRLRLKDIMSRQPYRVSPDASLADTAARMAQSREDCAIIVRGDQVLGLFTSTDALRVLSEVFTYEPLVAA